MEKYFLQLNNLFSQHDEIKLIYLFGSQYIRIRMEMADFANELPERLQKAYVHRISQFPALARYLR